MDFTALPVSDTALESKSALTISQPTVMSSTNTPISEKQLLQAIASMLSQYISETDPYILFNGLLDTLLEVTQSEYGFIGEVLRDEKTGAPYVRSYATTNIAWSEETQKLYEANRSRGMIFSRLDSLYGAVLKSGQAVISNQPKLDSRSCGLPLGHPPLNSFLGLPFYGQGKMLGMVGIANRQSGYQIELADSLQPFLTACGSLIEAYRNNVQHLNMATQLKDYQQRLSELSSTCHLGVYEYDLTSRTILQNGQPILLTRKEMSLLELLINNRNLPVEHANILDHVWPDVLVGEASIRALVRRLRQKLPGLPVKTVSGVGYLLKL